MLPGITSRILGRILIFEEASLNLLQDILYEAGELEKRVPYEDIVNTEFAQKAIKK